MRFEKPADHIYVSPNLSRENHLLDQLNLGRMVRGIRVGQNVIKNKSPLSTTAILKREGISRVFLDLNIDCNTNEIDRAIGNVLEIEPEIISISGGVGITTIRRAVKYLSKVECRETTPMLAVSTPSHLRSEKNIRMTFRGASAHELTHDWARQGARAGARAVIAAAWEMRSLQRHDRAYVRDLTLIAEGIHKPGGVPLDGARGSCEPGDAVVAGADIVLMGRAADGPDAKEVIETSLSQIAIARGYEIN